MRNVRQDESFYREDLKAFGFSAGEVEKHVQKDIRDAASEIEKTVACGIFELVAAKLHDYPAEFHRRIIEAFYTNVPGVTFWLFTRTQKSI
jgi:hypothetical protein